MKRICQFIVSGSLLPVMIGCQSTVPAPVQKEPQPTNESLPSNAIATAVDSPLKNSPVFSSLGIYNLSSQYNFTDLIQKGVLLKTWLEYEDINGKIQKAAQITQMIIPEEGYKPKSVQFSFVCTPSRDVYTFYSVSNTFREPNLGGSWSGSTQKLELDTSFLIQPNTSYNKSFNVSILLPLTLDKITELGKFTFDKIDIVTEKTNELTRGNMNTDKTHHREVRQYCEFTLLPRDKSGQIDHRAFDATRIRKGHNSEGAK